MKKTLYLHVGQHKTGTSTIQSFMWRNRERMEKNGILYPDIGMAGPTHADFALSLPGKRTEMLERMFSQAATERSSRYQSYQGENSDNLFARLGQYIDDTDCSRILLSSECFMEWVSPADIRALTDRHCACPVKVVIFLRSQVEWIQAVFNQVVKDPGIRYGGELRALPQMDMLDYESMLHDWAAVFGESNIIVRPYTPSIDGAGGVLDDIFSILGIPDFQSYEEPSYNERNVSLSRWQLDVLHALNRRNAGLRIFERTLEVFSAQNAGADRSGLETSVFSFHEAKVLQGYYRKGNRRLSKKFCHGEALFGSPTRREYCGAPYDHANAMAEVIDRVGN